MDNNLIFFDKEGHSLNFNYNNTLGRYEGDILFDHNSSDTFKTSCIYLFEKVNKFEFENPPYLNLRKFQLFNEYGIDFFGSKYNSSKIDKIEPSNNDSNYYSKWIYGNNFDAKYPKGTFVKFDNLLEFTNPNQYYIVVSSKKNAILIITNTNNNSFESLYSSDYTNLSFFENKYIYGVNLIGIDKYVNSDLSDNLSIWNEFDFYDRLYNERKLNIVNSKKNDNILTIKNGNVQDILHYEYSTNSLSNTNDLIIEVITKTDSPLIYKGPLTFTSSSNRLYFGLQPIPIILKPDTQFKVNGSINNLFLTVDTIDYFDSSNSLVWYATGSQTIWNNKIWECVQAHTWSATSSINPSSASYWNIPNSLPIKEIISDEVLLSGEVYLTTDHYYFRQSFTNSLNTTLALASSTYKEVLNLFDIDLSYEFDTINASLKYPSRYADVNFYDGVVATYSNIGQSNLFYKKLIEVDEVLINELNNDISSNFNYKIIFTDLDEYGLNIKINKLVYQEEIFWQYSFGNIVDMERTIDSTLRNWLTRNYLKLTLIGIIPTLINTNNPTSFYYDTIILKTEYPNVPLKFIVNVGTTANFLIERKALKFYDFSNYLDINVNNKSYSITAESISTNPFVPNISSTLESWISTWSDILDNYGIYVKLFNNTIIFYTKEQSKRLDIIVKTGKSSLPSIDQYKVIDKVNGNLGCLITSNEIIMENTNDSFENNGFATGMLVSINNTIYPYNNKEYNIEYLNPNNIILSYNGPFWGLTGSQCNLSPFVTVAFDGGWTQGNCISSSFSNQVLFNNIYNPIIDSTNISNQYSTYSTSIFSNGNSYTDILHLQETNQLYVLGNSNIKVYNSINNDIITSIGISGTSSLSLKFNKVNDLVYGINLHNLYVIDPNFNKIIEIFTFSYNLSSMEINSNNGDAYLSYATFSNISIIDTDYTISNIALSNSVLNMVFNDYEKDMYLSLSNGTSVIRIDGTTRAIQTTYTVSGINLLLNTNIVYNPYNESVYVLGSELYKIQNNIIYGITISSGTFSSLLYNNISNSIDITDVNNNLKSVDINNDLVINKSIGIYGALLVNQYDHYLYVVSQTNSGTTTKIIDSNGNLIYTLSISGNTHKIIYNPDRKSVYLVQSNNNITEINVLVLFDYGTNSNFSTSSTATYGSLSSDFNYKSNIWLNTREYIRRPRQNFENDIKVKYYWKWYSDNVSEFFLYDFSGDQLPTNETYSYTGVKPLNSIHLNKYPNKDITKVGIPELQQTIFDKITYELSYIDDEVDISSVPEPMQLFIGFNSKNEGPLRSILQLYKQEDVSFKIKSTVNNYMKFETIITDTDYYAQISLSDNSSTYFVYNGLKEGQYLTVFLRDATNKTNQYVSDNNGILLKIRSITERVIILDFFKKSDFLFYETTYIQDYPKSGHITFLDVTFKVCDQEIGRFNVYGETEIEDIRYKIDLGNSGKLINPNDIFIFKSYDIKEDGIDWTFLNKKRKEMLMMKNIIYPYIGSYKSIINAINYFGYNDLELYEYYRNIDFSSVNYNTLFKVEIPDIFDNTVEGWKENDFIKHTFPNPSYETTNLFNLTYRITDTEGNNILTYSVDEVQKKLQGLKYWLQKNIIPLSHKIFDITGKIDFVQEIGIYHTNRSCQIINIKENFTPISFKLNEAYLQPVNSGSTVYTCILDFYKENDKYLPDYFCLDIKTYKTYKEWNPFIIYNIGSKVRYYDAIYESVISNNKLNNPKKYEIYPNWKSNVSYSTGDVVRYLNRYYIYNIEDTLSIINPTLDSNWIDITQWKEIKLEPIQKITEWRKINNLLPYNFTIDSNIDPFICIELISENGYGSIYNDKKNYEIKGLLDLTDQTTPDIIEPLTSIYTLEDIEAISIAVDDSYITTQNNSINIPITVNDDMFNFPITISIINNPSNGSCVVQYNNVVLYTPNNDYIGADTFIYELVDSMGNTSSAIVNVNILQGCIDPITSYDISISRGSGIVTLDFINNTDWNGGCSLLVSYDVDIKDNLNNVVYQTSIAGNLDNTPTTYTFSFIEGMDKVFIKVKTQSKNCTNELACVPTINNYLLNIPNNAPIAVLDTFNTSKNIPIQSTFSLMDNDYDLDNNPFIIYNGVFDTIAGGTATVYIGGTISYIPPTDYTGSDSFNYIIQDSYGLTGFGTVSININNSLPITNPDFYLNLVLNNNLIVGTPGLMINDYDPDGDSISVISGTLSSLQGGTVSVNSNGSFNYQPPTNYLGQDIFGYVIQDTFGATAYGTASISITSSCSDIVINPLDFITYMDDGGGFIWDIPVVLSSIQSISSWTLSVTTSQTCRSVNGSTIYSTLRRYGVTYSSSIGLTANFFTGSLTNFTTNTLLHGEFIYGPPNPYLTYTTNPCGALKKVWMDTTYVRLTINYIDICGSPKTFGGLYSTPAFLVTGNAGGGGGGGGCLLEGTIIKLSNDDEKLVENIVDGDLLKSFNLKDEQFDMDYFDTSEIETEVSRINKYVVDRIYNINGLKMSEHHKHFVLRNNMGIVVRANEILETDKVFIDEVGFIDVNIEIEYGEFNVYNIEIDSDYKYYIANEQLTHNKIDPSPPIQINNG